MKSDKFEERKKKVQDFIYDAVYVAMKEKELAAVMQVKPEDRGDLSEALKELLAEGKIEISKRGKYTKAEEKIWIGTFISHSKGFGFVEIEGEEQDFYIPENKVHGAFHKDTVQIAILKGQKGKRKEAEVVKIIEHGTTKIVGTYQKSKNFGFVLADNAKIGSDIFIPNERSKGAVDGHKVVVELTSYGNDSKNPEGKIVEILGHSNDPGVDIMSIVRAYELPTEFKERTMNQAERVPDEVLEADKVNRLDLCDVLMITIDGEDAKDLDDAVSLTKQGDHYCLGVHIADVTNYVQENSAMDKEALERGTSVYLVDRVIPMLPHRLSNGICSLNAKVERLSLSCLMTINQKGEVLDHRIAETVIKVDRRMSYTQVAKILEDKDEALREECQEVVPMLEQMQELASILRKKRKTRGSIDFDFPECKIILDQEGKPIDIKPYDRNVATKIIEDFMLIANETVAENFYWLEIPFVYRMHENPDPEKIEKLAAFIQNFGYYFKMSKEDIHPKEFQKLLAKIEGSKEEPLISRLTLRSMKKAKYAMESEGHFGLACRYYCHFTSPIRRYPDLQIHRIIKEYLRGKMKEERIEHYKAKLPQVAKQSSDRERIAEEAERETNKMKKAEYMEAHIGEVFEGIISGITSFGMYVELPNTIEGMVHVSTIPGDYFYYKEDTYEMVGEATQTTFKLGQMVRVKVKGIDKIGRTIDFSLEE